MEREELKDALRRLREHLDSSEGIDPELEGLLTDLDREIHARIEVDDPRRDDSLLEEAVAIDTRFAAKHPQLEAVMRELINALARMGI